MSRRAKAESVQHDLDRGSAMSVSSFDAPGSGTSGTEAPKCLSHPDSPDGSTTSVEWDSGTGKVICGGAEEPTLAVTVDRESVAAARSGTSGTGAPKRLSHSDSPEGSTTSAEWDSGTRKVICGCAEEGPSPSSSRHTVDGADLGSSFEEALEGFLLAQKRKGRAEGTLVSYRRYLIRLGLFLGRRRVRSLSDVTPRDVFAFWDEQLSATRARPSGGPLATGTLNVAAAAIRTFFSHLLDEGLLLVDPSRDLEGPRCPKKLPRNIPTARQMRQLVLSPDPERRMGLRDRAILELMYGTGLRASELCGLKLSHVDVLSRQVFVEKGKGGRQRLVPMGRKAAQALEAYLAKRGRWRSTASSGPEEGEALFLRQDGGPIRPPALRYILAKSRKAAHVAHSTPHTLRHACATHLLRGGAGIRQIQALLGHASIESTEIYTKVETSDLRAMLDKHHPRSRA